MLHPETPAGPAESSMKSSDVKWKMLRFLAPSGLTTELAHAASNCLSVDEDCLITSDVRVSTDLKWNSHVPYSQELTPSGCIQLVVPSRLVEACIKVIRERMDDYKLEVCFQVESLDAVYDIHTGQQEGNL